MARTTYENKNAAAVLAQVQKCLAELQDTKTFLYDEHYEYDYKRIGWNGYGDHKKFYFHMDAVFEELSIFDWWNDTLSVSQLKEMEKFLKTAIKLGYTGYVCFNVGATGCSHGMWAYKNETETGYSPDGETLWRGFRAGSYNEWDACLADETWLHDIVTDVDHFTLKDVKNMLNAVEV